MTINAAILILTQNTVERKIYLKTSLYFLFKNFNHMYKYPIIILHEGDYKERDIQEILGGIRGDYKNLVTFKIIDKEDFELPNYIDKDKLEKSINSQIVPYWRNTKYRLMCNFWLNHFTKYCDNYDYVMRLDDDSIIEETINQDLFKLCKEKDTIYMSNIVHVDCGICNYGMKELFLELFPEKKNKIDALFVKTDINKNNTFYNKFVDLYKIINDNKEITDNIEINMPIMYYNNFFITNTAFWKRTDVIKTINHINKSGNIFYYRYGDAPLQTIILSLFESDKIVRTVFKYSKRMQRECFIDLNNNINQYMPKDYINSTCILTKND